MKNDVYYNCFVDRLIEKLSSYTPLVISIYTTIFVLAGSIPAVYLFAKIFATPYTGFLFITSVALPIILTPITILLFIRLTKHLKYFQDELEKEIQENKKKDILLFEQARFVLMGEMMANISHQWKQPLNTIGLSVVNAKFSDSDNLEKHFDTIEDNINYLATTIDDFMSFFDKKAHMEIRELEDIINEIRSIIHVQIENRGVTLEIEVNSSYGEIQIASSISQVLLNLLNNAKDAFDDSVDAKKINLKFISMKKGLEIICCDTGLQ